MKRFYPAFLALLLAPAFACAGEPPVDCFGDPLPAGALARLGTVRWRAGGIIFAVAFSPDGKLVASSEAAGRAINPTNDSGGPVRLWDAETGKEIARLKGGPIQARSLLFADGKTLLTVDIEGNLRTWDTKNGAPLKKFTRSLKGITCLAMSADGRSLFTGSSDGVVRQWLLATGLEARQFAGHVGPVVALAVTKTRAFSAGLDGSVREWDLMEGKEARSFNVGIERPQPGRTPAAAFSADGKWFAAPDVAGIGRTVKIWDVSRGEAIQPIPLPPNAPVHVLAFAPGGKVLAGWIGAQQGSIRLWGVASGKELRAFDERSFMFAPLAFSPDGKFLAFAGGDHAIRLWQPALDREQSAAGSHHAPILALAYLPGAKAIVSASVDQSARLWDAKTGKELARFDGQGSTVSAVAALPDGTVLTGGYNGTVAHWKLEDGKPREIRAFDRYPTSITALAASPDGQLAAAGGSQLMIFSVPTGKQLHVMPSTTSAVAFAPDGRLLASGATNGAVTLWDMRTYEPIRSFSIGKSLNPKLAFSPDGKALFVAANNDGALFEVSTGQERLRVTLPKGGAGAVAVSPDGRFLAAGMQGAVHFYSAVTGEELGAVAGHTGAVRALAFAPDGRSLASTGEDAVGLVWDARPWSKKVLVQPAQLTADEIELLWKSLAGGDGTAAYQAVASLVAGGDTSVALLKKRLVPLKVAALKDLTESIKALASDDFDERQKAQSDLELIGESARAQLVKAKTDGALPLEARRRVDQILIRLRTVSPEKAQTLRALEALEKIDTPEARQLLERLTTGTPGVWLTEEAQNALRRMKLRE